MNLNVWLCSKEVDLLFVDNKIKFLSIIYKCQTDSVCIYNHVYESYICIYEKFIILTK